VKRRNTITERNTFKRQKQKRATGNQSIKQPEFRKLEPKNKQQPKTNRTTQEPEVKQPTPVAPVTPPMEPLSSPAHHNGPGTLHFSTIGSVGQGTRRRHTPVRPFVQVWKSADPDSSGWPSIDTNAPNTKSPGTRSNKEIPETFQEKLRQSDPK